MTDDERTAIERAADVKAAEAPPVGAELKARLRVLLAATGRRDAPRRAA